MAKYILSVILSLVAISWVQAQRPYETANFSVSTNNLEVSKQVADYAENYRHDWSMLWYGRDLPTWNRKCPIRVKSWQGGGGGATNLAFYPGGGVPVSMSIQGNAKSIYEDVLPHEVQHAVIAHNFRRPLTRWADEGIATQAESLAEHLKLEHRFYDLSSFIPFAQLMNMQDYPKDTTGDGRRIALFYAESHLAIRFLLNIDKDRNRLLAFCHAGMEQGWDTALREHYNLRGIQDFESQFKEELSRRRTVQQQNPFQMSRQPLYSPMMNASVPVRVPLPCST